MIPARSKSILFETRKLNMSLPRASHLISWLFKSDIRPDTSNVYIRLFIIPLQWSKSISAQHTLGDTALVLSRITIRSSTRSRTTVATCFTSKNDRKKMKEGRSSHSPSDFRTGPRWMKPKRVPPMALSIHLEYVYFFFWPQVSGRQNGRDPIILIICAVTKPQRFARKEWRIWTLFFNKTVSCEN